jgi:MFS family permease
VATPAPDPRRWKALALICRAFFMVVLDIAIVNVALPSIGRDLEFSEDNLQWVITAYTLTFGGFLLLGGRAADLLGRRRMFMIGVGFFALASLACGLANSEATLIVARAVQGLGAAAIAFTDGFHWGFWVCFAIWAAALAGAVALIRREELPAQEAVEAV